MVPKEMALGWVCTFLCSFVALATGLDFTINRTPGNQVCGHLRCQINTDQSDTTIFSIVSLTIYDATRAATKEKLASIAVSVSDPELYINPAKIDILNASGSVSRYHADLSVDLRRVVDCQNATFLCELDYMSLSAQLTSQQKTLAPPKGDCSDNAALSQTAADLSSRTKELEDELSKLNEKYKDLEAKLNSILGQHGTIPTDKPTTQKPATTQEPPTQGPATTKEPQTQKPATTQAPSNPGSKSGCASGMSVQHPREKFTLQGNVQALCDTETDGGGWIIIQRRTKGDVDFYKNWDDYKKGFGTPDTDFWLGNDVIHSLTTQGYTELRIDLEYQDKKAFAHYSSFSVGDEASKYKLTVSGYSGTAGDDLSYHNGMKFTTLDQDNDGLDSTSCAVEYHGAWWYKDCYQANLNGEWGVDTGNAVIWNEFVIGKSLTSSEMKVRKT